MSEFKYLNKRCEDKVLFEVGYIDKLWREEAPRHNPIKYHDLISEGSIPSISSLDPKVLRRPHSVGEFKPDKYERHREAFEELDYESELDKEWARSLQRMQVVVHSDDGDYNDPNRAEKKEKAREWELAKLQDDIRKVRMGLGRKPDSEASKMIGEDERKRRSSHVYEAMFEAVKRRSSVAPSLTSEKSAIGDEDISVSFGAKKRSSSP